MKCILLILILFLSLQAQDNDCDSLKYKVCLKRGHVILNIHDEVLLPVKTELIDLPNISILINTDNSFYIFKCKRCKCFIEEKYKQKPDTTVIWKENINHNLIIKPKYNIKRW